MTRHKRHTIKLKSMYQWHRYVGITIALFVIMLSITGIMLNHTSEFELNKNYIENETLLNHYGIHAPKKVKSHFANNLWVSQWNSRLFLNENDLGKTNDKIIGFVFFQGMLVIGFNNSLMLYTTEGELIENLSGTEGVPAAINAIGITDKNLLAVNSENGIYTSDSDLSIWLKDPQVITIWNDPKPLPKPLQKSLAKKFRGKGLNMERVILDLHSGRLLGTGGVYFMDIIALLLTFLAGSGLWIWSMRLIKNRNKT